MTTRRRRRFTAEFKKRVALEALRGDRRAFVAAAHVRLARLMVSGRFSCSHVRPFPCASGHPVRIDGRQPLRVQAYCTCAARSPSARASATAAVGVVRA